MRSGVEVSASLSLSNATEASYPSKMNPSSRGPLMVADRTKQLHKPPIVACETQETMKLLHILWDRPFRN